MLTKVSWFKLPLSLLCMLLSYCAVGGTNHPDLDDFIDKSEEKIILKEAYLLESEGFQVDLSGIECQNDVVVTIQDINNCDTTVFFAPPIITVSTGLDGGLELLSGPIPDSAPGAGDGTPLEPGTYEAVYGFTDHEGELITCTVGIDVKSGFQGAMSCQNLNLSVNQECEILITPFMVLTNADLGCMTHFNIEVTDEHGNSIGTEGPDGLILTADALYQELTASVSVVGGGNSCWSQVVLEDKFPPQIVCPTEPIITTCNGLDLIELPITGDNCANEATLVIIDETEDPFECDDMYLSRIVRTYVAVDGNGIQSLPCEVEILVERIILDDIDFPSDINPFTGSGLSCDGIFPLDENGNPSPLNSPLTGSGTGIPFIYGTPLEPGVSYGSCNIFVDYSDQVLTQGCKTKILRSWSVREWHCSGEFEANSLQIIEITDDVGPVITPIPTIYGSTSHDCSGVIQLPPVEAYDACGEVSRVDITYPGGMLQNSNGGVVQLPIGINTVTYTVFDECLNSSSIDVEVVIADSTSPVPVCEINTVVALPHDGNVEVWAETFDDGSHDECGIAEIYVRRMDPECTNEDILFDESVFFCCSDVGQEVLVVLRVLDHAGNFNECMVVVHVQDKIAPEITCPDDMTIYCTDTYDLNEPNQFFGAPIVSDNCTNANNVQQRFLTEPNSCNTGVLEREIFVLDEGGEVISSCIQNITILPTDAFNADDIIWPEDFALEGCNTDNLEPDRLDAEFAYPVVASGSCDLVGFNWDDDVFSADPNSTDCFKIIRHWTLINWCETVDGEYTTYEYDQVLIVSNVIDPTITCAPVTFSSNDGDCDEVAIDVSVMGMDDCTMDLGYKWSLDLDADGTFEHTGVGSNITGMYPVGDHIIEWIVTDLCGNESFCHQPLKIFNDRAPQAICIFGLSVDLNPMDLDGDGEIDNEMVVLWANDFNQESFQPCGNEVVASFSADTTDTFLELDCDDIGIFYVDLWVTDVNTGLSAICQTFVDVQDNNNVDFCTGNDGARADVSGRIYTEEDINVENVEVNLMGSPLFPEMTDEEGLYAFPNMPIGGQYEIAPLKNDDYHNGVSTIDIVMIQRHILGITDLDSPYKLIAADVNNSNSVSGLDLITIRKLVLGVYDEFPEVGSWTFIEDSHVFVDEENPWSPSFNQTYEISSLANDVNLNFVAVKMGDVNNSVITNLTGEPEVATRSLSTKLQYEVNHNGYESEINIYASEEFKVSGAQMVIDLGNTFEGAFIAPGTWNIKDSQYRFVDDKLIVSYNDAEGATTKANTPLFTIHGSGSIDQISVVEDLLQSEMYDENMKVIGLDLDAKTDVAFAVSNASPNPFSTDTNIEISVEEDQVGVINIYNTQGQLINTKEVSLKAGNNNVSLTHTDFNEYGTMMLRIQTRSFDHTMLVVHVK